MNRNGSDRWMISGVCCLNLYTISANHETADVEERPEMSSHFLITISSVSWPNLCCRETSNRRSIPSSEVNMAAHYLAIIWNQTIYMRFMGQAVMLCRWLMAPINYHINNKYLLQAVIMLPLFFSQIDQICTPHFRWIVSQNLWLSKQFYFHSVS